MICSVCTEEMGGEENVVVFACSHSFHTECFRSFLLRSENRRSCPLCRSMWDGGCSFCSTLLDAVSSNHIACFRSLARSRYSVFLNTGVSYPHIGGEGCPTSLVEKGIEKDSSLVLEEIFRAFGPSAFVGVGFSSSLLDVEEATCLTLACEQRASSCAKWLLDKNLFTKEDRTSALHVSLANSCVRISEYILDSGVDLSNLDSDGDSLLFNASSSGLASSVSLLLRNRADPNGGRREEPPIVAAIRSPSPLRSVPPLVAGGAFLSPLVLMEAARRSDLLLVDFLINCGCEVNGRQGRGTCRSALEAACDSGSQRMVFYLLSKGANPGEEGSKNCLYLSCRSGMGEVTLLLLLSLGANPNWHSRPFRTPMLECCKKGWKEGVELLLSPTRNGTFLKTSPRLSTRWAQEAARSGSAEVLDFLFKEVGDEVDIQKVMRAALTGKVFSATVFGVLKERGGRIGEGYSISSSAIRGMGSSMMYALFASPPPPSKVEECILAILEEFSDREADRRAVQAEDLVRAGGRGIVSYKGSEGRTLLHLTSSLFCREWARRLSSLLLDYGADPDAKDKEGKTPLFHCMTEECASLLVMRGASLSLRNSEGKSLLHSLAEEGRASVIMGRGWKKEEEEEVRRQAREATLDSWPLGAACKWEDEEGIVSLIRLGADPNAWVGKECPLTLAAKEARSEIVTCLLSERAKPSEEVLLCVLFQDWEEDKERDEVEFMCCVDLMTREWKAASKSPTLLPSSVPLRVLDILSKEGGDVFKTGVETEALREAFLSAGVLERATAMREQAKKEGTTISFLDFLFDEETKKISCLSCESFKWGKHT